MYFSSANAFNSDKVSILLSPNPLPNEKFLDVTKLKAFADNTLNVPKITISLFVRAENTVGKVENDGYQHFLLFLQCFPNPSS